MMIESRAGAPASGLIGRDAERERLDAVLDQLRHGSAALIVRGEPGIGKSAFLHHARERAGDLGARILATACTSCSARSAAERCRCPHRGGGHSRQRSDCVDNLDPDPFKVALAAYQLVCDAADDAAVIVVVDDAHWLDRSSLAVLTFIARRLETEPVALLAAIRDGYPTPAACARRRRTAGAGAGGHGVAVRTSTRVCERLHKGAGSSWQGLSRMATATPATPSRPRATHVSQL